MNSEAVFPIVSPPLLMVSFVFFFTLPHDSTTNAKSIRNEVACFVVINYSVLFQRSCGLLKVHAPGKARVSMHGVEKDIAHQPTEEVDGADQRCPDTVSGPDLRII